MAQLRARRARIEDAASIAAIYAPFVTDTAVSFETTPPDAAEIGRRIAEIGGKYPWLVAEDEAGIAGYAYASQHSARAAYAWSADVSIYLHPAYRRQGLGTRLYQILFPLLARLGYRSLYAGATVPNAGSVALHRAMGMTEVGVYRNVGFKLGAWHDVAWLGFSFPDSRAPTSLPPSFDAFSANAIDVAL